jgi:vesicular inhibitory amino acid transporter
MSPESDGVIGEFDWDDIASEPAESPTTPRPTLPFSRKVATRPPERTERTERTPLLRKTISFTDVPHPRRTSTAVNDTPMVPHAGPSSLPGPPTLRRRSSAASARSMKYNYGGQSTFGQTVRLFIPCDVLALIILKLFNSIAILLGIGMLSEPLAFAYAGWGMGFILIIFYGFISCYTCVPAAWFLCLQFISSQCKNSGRNNPVGSAAQIIRRHWSEGVRAPIHRLHQHTVLPGTLCR